MHLYISDRAFTPDATTKKVVDGLNFWIFDQNASYTYLNTSINSIKTLYPHKDITAGFYIYNSYEKWSTPTSIRYIIENTINSYDDGYVRGLFMFSGDWVVMENATVTRVMSDSMALPHEFDQVYYPYLGKAIGTAYDGSSKTLEGVKVSCFTTGRVSKDTFYTTKQLTNSLGTYDFGAWAGNRTTDSTYYWMIGEKAGYSSDTVRGWIKRQLVTTFPDLILNQIGAEEAEGTPQHILLSVTPNPSSAKVMLQYSLSSGAYVTVKVYDIVGKEVKSLIKGKFGAGTHNAEWDGRYENGEQAKAGIYFFCLDAGEKHIVRKITLIK